MARRIEVVKRGRRVQSRATVSAPIEGRNAGRGSPDRIDTLREAGAARIVVPVRLRQAEARRDFRRQRNAEKSASVRDHEVHHPGIGMRSGRDQVAFVLPVLVIGDDDDFAAAVSPRSPLRSDRIPSLFLLWLPVPGRRGRSTKSPRRTIHRGRNDNFAELPPRFSCPLSSRLYCRHRNLTGSCANALAGFTAGMEFHQTPKTCYLIHDLLYASF